MNRFKKFMISPFISENRINKPLIIIFLFINGIVLFNAIYHSPYVGYDAPAHLKYIQVLSKFKLPTPRDTYQFYSPPLPYFLPALLYSFGAFHFESIAKFAQLLNVLFSIGLTFYLIRICDIIRPNNGSFKITSLVFIGMLPVYYKTFAFIRGEPLVTFLSMFVVYQTLTIFRKGRFTLKNIVALGFSLGLLILARQMGFFLIPAIIIFVVLLMLKRKQKMFLILTSIILSLFIAFIVGGWFYIYHYNEYGSAKTYILTPRPKFSFSNQPLKFYFGLSLDKLFSDPVRRAFPNQFLPIFYSEIWGDYWCYFIVYGKDTRDNSFIIGGPIKGMVEKRPVPLWFKSNYYEIRRYLSRVNLLSLFPSAFLLAGIILGAVYLGRCVISKLYNDVIAMHSLIYLVVIIPFVGYFWYLIMYPSPIKGDTVKATYIFQIFPFISILSGELLQLIKQKYAWGYKLIVTSVLIITLHNLPMFITRYILIP